MAEVIKYGNTLNTSVDGGWRAFIDYEVYDTTDTSVVYRVYQAGIVALNTSDHYFAHTSSSVQTVKLGSTTITNRNTGMSEISGRVTEEWLSVPDYNYLARGHTAQTKTIAFSVTLGSGWTKRESEWTSLGTISGTSSLTFNITVPALESWTVTLDAQGGTGAASSLTKYYGETLSLPQPSKDGYEFSHWTDGTTNYTTTYTANAAASLTAVYTPVITAATITQLYAARDDGSGTWDSQTGKHTSASDDGGYVYIRAWWRVEGADAATVSLGASMDSTPAWTGTAQQTSKPGTGEIYIEGVAEWLTGEVADVTGQYDVTVTLSTGAGNPSDTRGTTVSTAFFTIDVLAGGHGIAFGKPATRQLFDVGMETNFDHDVKVLGTPLVPIGTILDFAAATAPTGYLVCDGSAVSRTTYSALFAVIGTTWGAGDGSTTFNIPDFRGRTSIGSGTGTAPDATAHALGSGGGTETVTLSTSQIPAHSHNAHSNSSYKFYVGQADAYFQSDKRVATASSSGSYYFATQSETRGFTEKEATENAGGGGSHGNMTPYRTVTKIIRAI